MIVVSAATGEYGRLVVDHLLNRVPPAEVAVAVRYPAKADDMAARGVEVRHADYDEPDSLRRSFEGAERLLFISSPTWDSSQRMNQHHNVIAAARETGVELLAYTGALGADVSDAGGLADHHETECAIVATGIPYTILRHPIYSDFFIHPGLQTAIDTGELTSCTNGRGMNTATRVDLAAAAAIVLTGARASQSYDFTGRLWTYPQLAEVLSDLAGRTITYRQADVDEGIMEMIGPLIRAGLFERQTEDLEAVLGRSATRLEDAVAAVIGAPTPA